MIPSRGLRYSHQSVALGRRRIESYGIRQFSSNVQRPIKTNSVLSNKGKSTLFSQSITRPAPSKANILIRNATSIRFASTAPSAIPPVDSPIPSIETSTPEFKPTPLDVTADINPDILSAPEHIGYLHSLGLDYGWGPTAIMEWMLEHIHVLAGTPWWVSIGIAAAAWRVILFKPYLDAAENASRMATIKEFTAPVQAQMMQARTRGDTTEMMFHRAELQRIYKRAGISMWKSFVPMVQIFIGYGTWKLLRQMSDIPVPGLLDGGVLWFYNLTIPDPYYLLPLATSAILHFVLKKGGETGVSTLTPGMLYMMQWGMPALSMVFTSFMPAAVQFSFLMSSSISFGQATLFRSPKFRAWANMTPLPNQNPSPSENTLRMKEIPVTQGETKATKRFSLDGSIGNVMERFQSAKKVAVDHAKERRAKQDDSSAKARADAYEERRRREIAEEVARQNERRALERERRKMERGRKRSRKD
ncbi:hypothetical protein sscle_13g092830 [Sclerotinia sclerotiorum 1980 UF-70]|uniref:Membrane insertase YidC/Oxa/ALB C-terminal domain-containing protein n=1 Tax=Sclerotinia sclerotiorum (strain ATCC 18683 / 1980 / Ss-1) TaxID=665079 RepID=A0A1D9QIR5_SCLS1|nr:hypothetical protein sscle_13g092830 [Sclerotinia sclerotiorum 1980 UF-70]